MVIKKPGHRSSLDDANFDALRDLLKPHIESFDHMIDAGLKTMFIGIKPLEVPHPTQPTTLKISMDNPKIFEPQKERGFSKSRNILYPFECRQAKISYTGTFTAELCFQYDNGPIVREKFNFGQFPIMLQSKLCNLRGASPKKLVSYKEEASEVGGYFILNGLERVMRLLIMPKRNYPMSTVRSSFSERREGYTDKAVVIRILGREYMLPVGIVLKALIDTTDREIYVNLTSCYNEKYEKGKGAVGTQLVGERAKIILDEVRDLSLFTRLQCLQYIGEHFQPILQGLKNESHHIVADAVLRDYILVHLDNNFDKFNLLIFMLQKLFSLIDQTSVPDNPDSLQNQEVLLPGHLITLYLKEKLEEWLQKGKRLLLDEIEKKGATFEFGRIADVKKVLEKNHTKGISTAIENMLKTGRLVTTTGLDLHQRAGYTVQAERINFLRFISHFRAVHRGSSFAGLRTTTVRKLLPESWGFLCPVHTPDGEPCGLLNHMTRTCRVTSFYDSEGNIKDYFKIKLSILNILVEIGMTQSLPKIFLPGPPEVLTVLLDGCIVGFIPSTEVEKVVAHIRELKVSSAAVIPNDMEVGYVPLSMGGAYPGLYLFTSPSRFVRPVRNLSIPSTNENVELIGPFEQVFMEIRCPDGGDGGRKSPFPATHEEIHPTGMLSVVGNLTPWSDHNQSPRNMYQCQMAKQTMGFSSQTIQHRADQKLYHLQTPQTPIVRTRAYSEYSIDEYPSGTNAIVAVLAYTGYDMEDAMILNKSSVERGMFHGQIYQTETIDLTEKGGKSDQSARVFRKSKLDKPCPSIDSDGLPHVGQMIWPDEPYCSTYNEVTNKTYLFKKKGSEPVYVDYVAVDTKTKKNLNKVNIRFRHPRNPVIGDKFSSRHGQKGVCSQLWPDIDMPFSGTTGMRPDLIINPHAFPSRMTIAMLLESVAAKGGSLHGKFKDATPFRSSVKKDDEESGSKSASLVDELGVMLKEKGFNYHGCEVLYSGVYGTELTCEIFIGPVYYQRLRHMVSDKYQVRSTGTIDQVTRQPIKGRKRGGGIRFGEMERDSLLAHGAAYLLHDRLHTCSDYHIADVCSICGSMLTTTFQQPRKRPVREIGGLPPARAPRKVTCHACQSSKGMEKVAMPYIFRYLAAELAAMNIKMTLKLTDGVDI
ncbi:DNA-directed RNA polymerase I subunit 2-like isoform X2 [Cicer arietinum]|uniref:DNA-directed RNA polymerase I subunit 2-like isoform X2 n=1 Tax=Cicer arietinum TaxID=3827 RepID=UPI003CC69A85